MFIIHGTSAKAAVVGQVPIQCPSCGAMAPHALVRSWRVSHVFWFPLFSHGVQHVLACPCCRAAHPFTPPAGMATPLPFLHRFGCLLVLAVPLLAFLGLVSLALIAPRQKDAGATAARSAFRQFEGELVSGKSSGNGPEANELATCVQLFLQIGSDRSLESEKAAIAVRLDPGAPRRVVVLVRLDTLKRCSDSWRREFLEGVKQILEDKLSQGDEIFVGLKGKLVYGATATGTVGGTWSVEVGTAVSEKPIERAFEPRPAAPAPMLPAPRPCVRQQGEADCGPAAIETIAQFYGKELTPEARSLTMDKDGGSSLLSLSDAAERIGLAAKAVKVTEGADPWKVLSGVSMPAIVHVRAEDAGGHFMVVYEAKAECVQVADPARGLREIPKEEFLAQWTGVLLLVSGDPAEEGSPPKGGGPTPPTDVEPN